MFQIETFDAGDKVNNTIAVGAVSSPLWLNWLYGVSEMFGLLLPIFGVLWLCFQMYTHWRKYYKDKDKQ